MCKEEEEEGVIFARARRWRSRIFPSSTSTASAILPRNPSPAARSNSKSPGSTPRLIHAATNLVSGVAESSLVRRLASSAQRTSLRPPTAARTQPAQSPSVLTPPSTETTLWCSAIAAYLFSSAAPASSKRERKATSAWRPVVHSSWRRRRVLWRRLGLRGAWRGQSAESWVEDRRGRGMSPVVRP